MSRDKRAATLVVGAGQAGISLVTALRELGDTGPVVLVGDQPEPPYERPPLSKGYLRGEYDRGFFPRRRPGFERTSASSSVTVTRVVSL